MGREDSAAAAAATGSSVLTLHQLGAQLAPPLGSAEVSDEDAESAAGGEPHRESALKEQETPVA